MLQLKEPQKAVEWTIYKDSNFSVSVRGWKDSVEFKWNVYAHIFDTHPLFGKVEVMMCIPLHGGPTYDRLLVSEPAGGIQYDWQRVERTYKIGSDYQHAGDYYEECSYEDGIPPMIRHDAEELAKYLFECVPE